MGEYCLKESTAETTCRDDMMGDGVCNSENDIEACNWDGGDCQHTCQGNANWIGDNECDGINYNKACQWDGGDCDDSCHGNTDRIGNQKCDHENNNAACSY